MLSWLNCCSEMTRSEVKPAAAAAAPLPLPPAMMPGAGATDLGLGAMAAGVAEPGTNAPVGLRAPAEPAPVQRGNTRRRFSVRMRQRSVQETMHEGSKVRMQRRNAPAGDAAPPVLTLVTLVLAFRITSSLAPLKTDEPEERRVWLNVSAALSELDTCTGGGPGPSEFTVAKASISKGRGRRSEVGLRLFQPQLCALIPGD